MGSRCTLWGVALCGLLGCHSEPVHVFRVAFPATPLPGAPPANSLLPEACYQPSDLPIATASPQIAAEAFCGIGKRPAHGVSTTSTVTSEQWSLFGDAVGGEYLIRQSAKGDEQGISGHREGDQFVFAATETTFGAQCPVTASSLDAGGFFPPTAEPSVMECDGKCVNISADPAHCGACDFKCPNSFVCAFGRCQPSCGGVGFMNCGGVQVDTSVDRNNCGMCNNPCPPGTVCSPNFGFSAQGHCVPPCEAQCARDSLSDGCGAPAILTREVNTLISVSVSGDVLSGELVQGVSYSCLDGGCAVDFGSRCPSCSVTVEVNGRETATKLETHSQ
jgi:hypothetical protein